MTAAVRAVADTYDETSSPDPTAAVEFLAGLAGGGPVLELAIGSGRVALPLAARGLEESDGERQVEVRSVTEDSVELRPRRYNYQAQTFIRQTVIITDGSIQLKPFSLHYR